MAEQTTHNSISPQAVDKLIAAHDGDMALLWLYRLRKGALDPERAAGELCRTLEQIRAAEEKLRRLGLLDGGAPAPSPAPAAEPGPEEQLPEYSAEEISRRSAADATLQDVFAEAAQVLGHTLSAAELRVVFGIYDHLGMPPEVIVELLHYCAELNKWKYHGDRRLTPRFLEQEAYAWANKEILTLDLAEDYIRAQRERHSELGRLRTALQLPALSPTQQRDLLLWLEQGFGEEAISVAADRTITNTGALKWSYLRKILQSWHENGLHSQAEIREKDPARAARPAPAPEGSYRQKPLSKDEWDSILNKI